MLPKFKNAHQVYKINKGCINEHRLPKKGEWYMNQDGTPVQAEMDHTGYPSYILIVDKEE